MPDHITKLIFGAAIATGLALSATYYYWNSSCDDPKDEKKEKSKDSNKPTDFTEPNSTDLSFNIEEVAKIFIH